MVIFADSSVHSYGIEFKGEGGAWHRHNSGYKRSRVRLIFSTKVHYKLHTTHRCRSSIFQRGTNPKGDTNLLYDQNLLKMKIIGTGVYAAATVATVAGNTVQWIEGTQLFKPNDSVSYYTWFGLFTPNIWKYLSSVEYCDICHIYCCKYYSEE